MTSQTDIYAPIIYHYHGGDLHEIIVEESSRRAVDAFFNHLTGIHKHASPELPTFYLIDFSAIDLLPIRYLLPTARDWLRGHEANALSRTAILHNPTTFVSLMESIVQSLPLRDHGSIHFYPAHQREDALAWLHESMALQQA